MLNCFRYNKKEVKKVTFNEVSFANGEYFIDLNDPNDKELGDVSRKTGISVRDLTYTLDKEHVRPLIQNRKGYSFFTFKKVGDRKPKLISFFVSKKYILAIHSESSDGINEIIKNSKKEDFATWFSKGLSYLLFRVLLEISRQYTKTLLEITEHVEDIEQKMFQKGSFDNEIKSLFYYKKSLIYYRDALIKNKDMVEDMQEGALDFVRGQDKEYYVALKAEVAEIITIVDTAARSIQDSMDLSIGMEANKLNKILRGFTVITTIILFPTLISGIWGMNFANIPFYNDPNGFYIPLILMIFSIVILGIVFKLKKWM